MTKPRFQWLNSWPRTQNLTTSCIIFLSDELNYCHDTMTGSEKVFCEKRLKREQKNYAIAIAARFLGFDQSIN